MPSVMAQFAEDATPTGRRFEINMAAIHEDAMKGPRRAAAFVGAVYHMIDRGAPDSVAIPGNMQLRILPDPLPLELQTSIVEELMHWVIGNALKELDQFLSHLLDRLWTVCEICKWARREVPTDFTPSSIEAKTNVSEKHRILMNALALSEGPIVEDQRYLTTLSGARNCFAHNLGVVDERRAPDGTMSLEWLRFRPFMEPEGHDVIYLDEVTLPWVVPASGPIGIEVTSFQKIFSLGERITLTPHEIVQIAHLYQGIIERLIVAVQSHMAASGIEVPRQPDAS